MKDGAIRIFWVVLVLALLSYVFMSGLARVEKKAVKQANAEQAVRVAEKVAQVEQLVVPQHVAAQERIRYVTKEIIREVPVYVPAGACALPPGWRVLHDAAAAGEVPDPARIPDAAPIAPDAAASAVAANYGACHENAERLRALQQWVHGVSE